MGGTDAYKALADPTRRQILKLLREGDLPAGAIAQQFEISWPSVSRHLGVLTNAGLIEPTRRGQQLVYSLTTSVLVDIVTELADMTRLNRVDPEPEATGAHARTPDHQEDTKYERHRHDGSVRRGERRLDLGGMGLS
jgi:ArsR family transcriptional regulator, arsenate/arsenite/antimonite-responsive transcriptional repressor